MSTAISKLKNILNELEKVTPYNEQEFVNIAERLKSISSKIFDNHLDYNTKIENILYKVRTSALGLHNNHIINLKNIAQIMIDNLELNPINELQNINDNNVKDVPNLSKINTKIFVVHGHNIAMKEATARILEKMGLKAIILHEMANNGSNTIIDKFTKNSDVGFAVVLLSSDDFGYEKQEDPKNAKFRARQNVIFELGFFFGKLGPNKVVAIFEQSQNFEKPSDIDGIVYIPYDSNGSWKFELARELKVAGYNIDANTLM